MAITRNGADFIGAVLEACVYGVYVTVFYSYMKYHSREKAHQRFELVHVLLVILFALTTVVAILDLTQQFHVVVRQDYSKPIGVLNATCTYLLFILDFLSQLVLIYRCYNVWSRRTWVAVVPLIFAFGGFACGMTVGTISALYLDRDSPSPEWLFPVAIVGYGAGCVVNAMVTGLMVSKIWKVYSGVKGYVVNSATTYGPKRPSLPWIISILIEGCVVLFAFQLAVTVLAATGDPAYNICAGPILAGYGLNATAMIVRVVSKNSYETFGSEQNRSTTLALSQSNFKNATGPRVEKSVIVSADMRSVDLESKSANV